ncbi:glycoside hydrolase family 32 protein [Mariniflexile rhizosphaerae]|uniref:glycoside hydrolase family 32 protein n=1 Tax=unclassified Mariniflexile TaxID=2643887 RepID=UPI0019676F22|nr:glycoside hydrolase family 32 protein [Mariniflexile sp. TRM1-10]
MSKTEVGFNEQHRLQYHFSPKEMWMNDPNGMVYYDGEYHLFFQHTPHTSTPDFPNMHWGHAISTDMVHWKELPPAIAPDEHGAIFSGSAVVDYNNTAGLQSGKDKTLISIFTYSPANGVQNQGMAYSNDRGRTWVKYENNPVLQNQGIADFRDPKVFWYERDQKWFMTLAVKDHVELYSSPDLKFWTKESEFGQSIGAHGGIWECPDLFSLSDGNGAEKWVMLVSINPGGPNGGSATQYFIGDFDGHKFTAEHSDIRWLDNGPDNYAGVTWSNVKRRKLLLGWMSNWEYSQIVPTNKWRGAMTVPRELELVKIDGQTYVASMPVSELNTLHESKGLKAGLALNSSVDLAETYDIQPSKFDLSFTIENKPFELKLSNDDGEYLLVGYDLGNREFYIDRRRAGKTSFSDAFGRRNTAKRISNDGNIEIRLLVDVSSIELFTDDGEVVMTSLFFPNSDFTHLELSTESKTTLKGFEINEMKSIW